MLFKFLKKKETSLHKSKSFWSTFKNAYLRRKNLRKFWLNLDKQNLPKEVVDITNLFINSESYDLTSKFWRHCLINHYNHMANVPKDVDPLDAILRSDYSGFSFLDEFSISKSLENHHGKIKIEADLLKSIKDYQVHNLYNIIWFYLFYMNK